MGFNFHLNIKKEINTGGLVILTFDSKIGFFGENFTRTQVVVPGTVVQESRQRKRRVPTVPTLSREVLGQYRRVLGQYSLGTVVLGQWSWDSGLETGSLGTVVMGQWSWDSSLGTVQSWNRQSRDSGLGTGSLGTGSLGTVVLGQAVLGKWSWDSAVLRQAVLGQWSWDSSLGTVQSWDSSLGTVPRSPGKVPESLGTV